MSDNKTHLTPEELLSAWEQAADAVRQLSKALEVHYTALSGEAQDNGGLLPCPFCGKDDLFIHESKSPDGTITWHNLHHGPTSECSVSFVHDDAVRLIELWNKRR